MVASAAVGLPSLDQNARLLRGRERLPRLEAMGLALLGRHAAPAALERRGPAAGPAAEHALDLARVGVLDGMVRLDRRGHVAPLVLRRLGLGVEVRVEDDVRARPEPEPHVRQALRDAVDEPLEERDVLLGLAGLRPDVDALEDGPEEGVVGHRRRALAVGRPVRVRGPRDRVVVEGRRADDGVEARDEADVVGLRQCLVDGDHRPQVPRQPLVARMARARVALLLLLDGVEVEVALLLDRHDLGVRDGVGDLARRRERVRRVAPLLRADLEAPHRHDPGRHGADELLDAVAAPLELAGRVACVVVVALVVLVDDRDALDALEVAVGRALVELGRRRPLLRRARRRVAGERALRAAEVLEELRALAGHDERRRRDRRLDLRAEVRRRRDAEEGPVRGRSRQQLARARGAALEEPLPAPLVGAEQRVGRRGAAAAGCPRGVCHPGERAEGNFPCTKIC